MRFLGIRTGKDRLSDEEYIEQLRRGLRMQRKMRYFHGVCGIVMIVLCVMCGNLFIHIIINGLSTHPYPNLVWSAFVFAAIMGLGLGLIAFQAGVAIGVAFLDHRKEQLLVDCWDALKQPPVE